MTHKKSSGQNGWQRSHDKIPEPLLQNARSLRKQPTLAESILWDKLRDRKLNELKFRRQHPFEGFILDFYCEELRLAIEVDGEIHQTKESLQYDKLRTEYLNEFGVEVLRFENADVVKSLDSVLNVILDKANGIKSHPHPK